MIEFLMNFLRFLEVFGNIYLGYREFIFYLFLIFEI